MKKRFPSFLAGAAAALALTALATSALAASGQVQFNFAGVALDGEMKITAGQRHHRPPTVSRSPAPSSMWTRRAARPTTCPSGPSASCWGVEVGYDSASRTVLLGEQTVPRPLRRPPRTAPSGTRRSRRTAFRYASGDTGIDHTGAPGYALTNLPEGWGAGVHPEPRRDELLEWQQHDLLLLRLSRRRGLRLEPPAAGRSPAAPSP